MTPVTAYVPLFNAEGTIRRAVESLLGQTIKPAEVLVVDDGSTDRSLELLQGLDVRVVSLPRNLGRGAARARAMSEARHPLVLCCDATNTLEPTFLENALPWFEDQRVAAVFGWITQPPARNAAERWRGRHLFKLDSPQKGRHQASLGTGGTLMRASAAQHVGGFDSELRHAEDRELGVRLLAAGFDVVYDPRLTITSIAANTLGHVLERHWRWTAGIVEDARLNDYLRSVLYSVRFMAMSDVRAGDLGAAFISCLAPHYCYWRTRRRLWRREAQAGSGRAALRPRSGQ